MHIETVKAWPFKAAAPVKGAAMNKAKAAAPVKGAAMAEMIQFFNFAIFIFRVSTRAFQRAKSRKG